MKYAYGNGNYGCLFDHIEGPFDSVQEAANAASELFELNATQFRLLVRHQYLDLSPESGAQYVEIFECDSKFNGEYDSEES